MTLLSVVRVMAQIQFSLIKKIKIGCPEHSLPLTLLRPITSHFCLALHLQSGRHMCITSKIITILHLAPCYNYRLLLSTKEFKN